MNIKVCTMEMPNTLAKKLTVQLEEKFIARLKETGNVQAELALGLIFAGYLRAGEVIFLT